ncbi:MAG: ABC transporter permease [Bacteroidetes bacterium]|nr:ABC transporter permease [Bacteroidota bacterium]
MKNDKPPKAAELLLKILLVEEDFFERLGDYEEGYIIKRKEKGKGRADLWYWLQVLLGIPVFIKKTFYWGTVMFGHYFKIALRNFRKQKLFSFINVLGLAVGLAACIMILFWVQDEMSYDKFNKNYSSIYRVEREMNFDGQYAQIPITSYPYGPTMVDEYPEVLKSVHLVHDEMFVLDKRNVLNRVPVLGADNSIFEIFDFKLINGDEKSALLEPRCLVLSSALAMQYFGTLEVVGKSLSVDHNGEKNDYTVTGVMQDVPANSHIQFNAMVSFDTYPEERRSGWPGNWLYTYVLLSENADIDRLESIFPKFLDKHVAAEIIPYLPEGANFHDVLKLRLKSLGSIHLSPAEYFEIDPQGNMTYIYVFSAIAGLILLIACINFMNLSTAKANKRAKEVGLRKSVGAYKQQLWKQFLSESTITAFAALLVALLLILLLLPGFNTLSGKDLTISILFTENNWVYLLLITIFTSISAGVYPAFVLSAYDPVKVFKEINTKRGSSGFRKSTTVFQFVISIALIICTFVVYNQMNYLNEKALGFEKENVIIIPANGDEFLSNMVKFRNDLLQNSQILSVSGSSNYPGNDRFSDTVFKRADSDEKLDMTFLTADYDFLKTYGIELVSGRDFSREFVSDANNAVIINESALVKFGLTNETALGKKLNPAGRFLPIEEVTIVGIAKDFNYTTLHDQVRPFGILLTEQIMDFISIRVAPGSSKDAVNYVEEKWRAMFPQQEFNFSFLDERIQSLYESEQSMGKIIMIFSLFSVFVGCLGLFGLASFTAEEKTKEIGIRKVLGSSVGEIIMMLSKQFVKWVLLANIIAWPLAYFTMDSWLQNFAYQTELSFGIFILAGFIAIIIALATVTYQAVKAALMNPVSSLKHE